MFTLTIKTDNAAFGDDPAEECGRILAKASSLLLSGRAGGNLLDSNGNTVGSFTLTDE